MQEHGKSPAGDPSGDFGRVQGLMDFWNELRITDDTGATHWGILGPLEQRVTDHLIRARPGDLSIAESLTARALFLISGQDCGP